MSLRSCWTAALMLFVAALLAAGTARAQVGTEAPDVTLRDQYDSVFTLRALRGSVVVLVGGDREGYRYMDPYIAALRERYGAAVRAVKFLHARGVPFFMRGYVRGRWRGTTAAGTPVSPVLLDWGGAIGRGLGWQNEHTNVYVIDGGGVLRFHAAGRGAEAEVVALLAAVADVGVAPRPGSQ